MKSASEVTRMVAEWLGQGLSKAEIIAKCAEAEIGWSYVWGATGQSCTPAYRRQYANRSSCPQAESQVTMKKCQVCNGSKSSCDGCKWYPNGNKTLIDDCQGFVKQVSSRVGIHYKGGGATSMWNDDSNWVEKGEIKDMPNKLCCIFWKNGTKMSHVGFHIGDGIMIHCSGEVKKEKLSKKATHYAIPKGLYEGEKEMLPTLRKGSSGEYVTLLQTKLIQLGYDLSPYGADGKFGNTTLRAVKQFQNDNGLVADGVVGLKSWEALNSGKTTLYTVTIQHVGSSVADEIVKKYGGTMVVEG